MGRDELLRHIKARLTAEFGDRLRGVVLYGSVARRAAGADSDLDLLVLLTGPVSLWRDLRRIVESLYPLQLESDRPIHALPANVDDFEAGDFALYRNAKAEGVRL
ncbi:MAG TPA: nucleotidyltransferase domain-containing protein [Polyangia bacterium]|jgi:predicted nucleotidyltransferase